MGIVGRGKNSGEGGRKQVRVTDLFDRTWRLCV